MSKKATHMDLLLAVWRSHPRDEKVVVEILRQAHQKGYEKGYKDGREFDMNVEKARHELLNQS